MRQRIRHSLTNWRSDRRLMRSNVRRSKGRESEPRPARHVLLCTSRTRRDRSAPISGSFRRRRAPLPACRHFRNPIAAIRLFDAEGSREGDRGPFGEPRILVRVVPMNSHSMRPWPSLMECGRKTRSKRCLRPTWLSRILPCSNWSPVLVAPSQATCTRVTASNDWAYSAT